MQWIVNDEDDMIQRQIEIKNLIDEKQKEIDKLKFEMESLNFLYHHFQHLLDKL
jgi:hypothetical protein